MSNVKTFAITVSPADNITNNTANRIARLLADCSAQYHIICEKTGKRHLHAFVLLNTPKTSSNFGKWFRKHANKILTDEGQDYHPNVCFLTKAAYNDDWVQKYLVKDPKVDIIASQLDKDPQTRLDEYLQVPDKRKKNEYNARYVRLSELFKTTYPLVPEPNFYFVCQFLTKEMIENRMQYQPCSRKMNRLVRGVRTFILGSHQYDFENHPPEESYPYPHNMES